MNTKQVLSIEQMQHLKKLGVDDSKASVYWHNVVKFEKKKHANEWILSLSISVPLKVKTVPTFTLQDILDLLPHRIKGEELCTKKRNINGSTAWSVAYRDVFGQSLNTMFSENLIDAAYEMLCWVVENGYLEKNKQ